MAASTVHDVLAVRDDPPAKKKKCGGGPSCAVAECTSTFNKGYTMHEFPSDTEDNRSRRNQWIKFVSTCRADFGPAFHTPTTSSRICTLHFTRDSYPASWYYNAQFGIVRKKNLNTDAVPTRAIHKPCRSVTSATTMMSGSRSQRDSGRRLGGICTATLSVSQTSTICATTQAGPSVCQGSTTTTSCLSSPVCTPSVLEGVSKVRGAYLKREKKRVSYMFLF